MQRAVVIDFDMGLNPTGGKPGDMPEKTPEQIALFNTLLQNAAEPSRLDRERTARNELRNRHPRLYAAAGDRDPFRAVPAGWLGIVDEVCSELERRCDCEQLAVLTVNLEAREKYGTLRLDTACPLEIARWFDDVAATAEALSETTCEDCGAAGATLRDGLWLHTLCDRCTVALGDPKFVQAMNRALDDSDEALHSSEIDDDPNNPTPSAGKTS